jgi:hypothetical protein
MALMAGQYADSIFHGVLREDRYPRYACIHRHKTPQEARVCADEAKKVLKNAMEATPMPPGWHYWESLQALGILPSR